MIVLIAQLLISQQRGEFVKGSNLGGTGTGELFLNTRHDIVRQNSTHRSNNMLTVCRCGSGRIDFQRSQSVNRCNRGYLMTDSLFKYLRHIGSRIGADQQYTFARGGQMNRGSTGQRCFTHTAFTGKK
ncbi:Uncharacterised protein [Salmonella enterica subsp. enterica]|nr:Uncharacterised protein [Salmonella enterica subsp. enterica]